MDDRCGLRASRLTRSDLLLEPLFPLNSYALLPLLHPDPGRALDLAREAVSAYAGLYRRLWLAGMRSKLGLLNEEADDEPLAEGMLALMRQHHADKGSRVSVNPVAFIC